MEIMKKEGTGKRKENKNTRKRRRTFTQRERKTKIQQNRKINENKARKGEAKTVEQMCMWTYMMLVVFLIFSPSVMVWMYFIESIM